jgi:hypothetical protein
MVTAFFRFRPIQFMGGNLGCGTQKGQQNEEGPDGQRARAYWILLN